MLGRLRLRYLYTVLPRALFAESNIYPAPALPKWPHAMPPQGKKLLKRRFDFGGSNVEMAGHIQWEQPHAAQTWHQHLYSFLWLREINYEKPSPETSSFAREWINSFIQNNRDMPPLAWTPEIAGTRLAQWMEHFEFILYGSSRIFRRRFARSLIQHTLYLEDSLYSKTLNAEQTLYVLWGLIAISLRLKDMRYLFPIVSQQLIPTLSECLHKDGMHRSMNPSQHLACLQMLINIREMLHGESPFHTNVAGIAKEMGTMLHFLCHGDERLALFSGSLLEDKERIKSVLRASGFNEETSNELPIVSEGHLCRLQQQDVRVFMMANTANTHRHVTDQHFHAPLAIEFSDGNERIVVNCGQYLGTDRNWQNVVRSPAAHSTLSLEGVDPVISENTSTTNTPQSSQTQLKQSATAEFNVAEGIQHRRSIALASRANSLTGKERITLTEEAIQPEEIRASFRFHLHPDIRCKKSAPQAIQLTSVTGKRWDFEASGDVSVALEESVYLGYKGKPQKTLQIVVHVPLDQDTTTFEWRFMKPKE